MKLFFILVALLLAPNVAYAHDDPVVTVRVMCDGFNVLDQDQVLGEISDSAVVHFDGTIQGSRQIQDWVQKQMDDDLRIQIDTIGTPERLSDGYTLNWTARFSRQDWRQQGVQSREAENTVVIHNGRITEWTATLDSATSPSETAAVPVPAPASTSDVGMPEIIGIPLTLWLAGAVAVVGVVVVGRGAVRR